MTNAYDFLPHGDSRHYWYAFWAAAPKGQCPVGHRGEFSEVRLSVRPSIRLSVCPSVHPPLKLLSLKFH